MIFPRHNFHKVLLFLIEQSACLIKAVCFRGMNLLSHLDRVWLVYSQGSAVITNQKIPGPYWHHHTKGTPENPSPDKDQGSQVILICIKVTF